MTRARVLVRTLPCGEAAAGVVARRATAAAARRLGRPVPRVSVAVVGDRRMRRLNRDFHGCDRTTDVLAFPLDPEEGEVVVCWPEARRQARRRGLDPCTEVVLYVVHGLLHLLGESDAEPAAARRMRRLERAILASLGYSLPGSHLEDIEPDAPPQDARRRPGR